MPSSANYVREESSDRRKTDTRYCFICGEPFKCRPYAKAKTCSSKCRGKYSSINRISYDHKCKECGEIYSNKSTITSFCSQKCINAVAFLKRNDNPEKYFEASLRNNSRRKDKSKLTVNYLLKLLDDQNGKCAITGEHMTFSVKLGQGRINTNCSVDQILPGGGYTEENVQLVCDIANRMKLDMCLEELKFWCKKVIESNA